MSSNTYNSRKRSAVPAGYSGTPLAKKLGIREGARVGLVGAPSDFEALCAPLPAGAELVSSQRRACELWIWFPSNRRELVRDMERRVQKLGALGLWICWPKKASGIETDLSEAEIRASGLARGLVDHKVCAIDSVFSGLKFARRKG